MNRAILRVLAAICAGLGFFFLCPALISLWTLVSDPGLQTGGPTKLAFKIHRSVSGKIPAYVDDRIASGIATTLGPHQIEATEWPVYGAFFYLTATAELQEQWAKNPKLASKSPKETGAMAIEASVRILLDEGHAHWVRDYWGDDYLEDENCFYRMLLVGGLTAHAKLTGSADHLPFLEKICEDMAADLDRSRHGLIDDYPAQCFPADVIAAIEMIRRAAKLYHQDRDQWAKDALNRILDLTDGKLPSYTASSKTGQAWTSTRGCTNGFCLPYIRQIDPELGEKLYQESQYLFWEEGILAQGWREFPRPIDVGRYYFDPDSGPVILNMGTAATGLGLGVARSYGDSERSSILGLELLSTSFPTVTGRLPIPSLVANRKHAPYFPEIVLMAQLAKTSEAPSQRGPIPLIFSVFVILQLLLGTLFLRLAVRFWKKRR